MNVFGFPCLSTCFRFILLLFLRVMYSVVVSTGKCLRFPVVFSTCFRCFSVVVATGDFFVHSVFRCVFNMFQIFFCCCCYG